MCTVLCSRVLTLRPWTGNKWFELHSYCTLCGMMHKSPCELSYTKAMTAHSLYRDGEFPQQHADTFSYEFMQCGPRHAAYFAAAAGAQEEAAETGDGEQ